MAKILIVVPPYFGHINPTLGVGAALLARGHEVTWLGLTELPLSTFPQGASYEYPKEFHPHSAHIASIIASQDEAIKYSANRMIKWAFETIWLPYHEIMKPLLPSILARIKPDVILHDEGLIAVPIAAHLLKIPYATSISSAPGLHFPEAEVLLPEDARWLKDAMEKICISYGQHVSTKILNSPTTNIVYTVNALLLEHTFGEHYHFIGPALYGRINSSEFDWSQISLQRKTIYISTGTHLDNLKHEFYKKVVDAFAGENINVLIAADPNLFEYWPDNFIPMKFWPQLDVLNRVDAVISHGGFNTINESLYYGKPILVVPMAVDQFGNALLVEQSGCGLRLRYKRLSALLMREAMQTLLNESHYKVNAEIIMKQMRESGGADKAAALILAQLT